MALNDTKPQQSVYIATAIVYGMRDATADEVVEAYQTLIDTGAIHTMPGTYGRHAQHLIDEGECV